MVVSGDESARHPKHEFKLDNGVLRLEIGLTGPNCPRMVSLGFHCAHTSGLSKRHLGGQAHGPGPNVCAGLSAGQYVSQIKTMPSTLLARLAAPLSSWETLKVIARDAHMSNVN